MSDKVQNVVRCFVKYRHIGPNDYLTPIMYLPLQHTCLNVTKPVTRRSVVDSIMLSVGNDLGFRRDDIQDVEFDEAPNI